MISPSSCAEELLVRRASAEDIPLIRSMADVVFRDTYRDILSPEQADYMMGWMYSPDRLSRQMEPDGPAWFIAEYRETPCAYASVQPLGQQDDGDHLFELQKIYVLPGFQGKQVGRLLYGHVCRFVKRMASGEACRIELHVNRSNPAIAFYRHLGFEILRAGDFPIGNGFFMNDYIMGVRL